MNVFRHKSVLMHWFEHAGTKCCRDLTRRPCGTLVPALQFPRICGYLLMAVGYKVHGLL